MSHLFDFLLSGDTNLFLFPGYIIRRAITLRSIDPFPRVPDGPITDQPYRPTCFSQPKSNPYDPIEKRPFDLRPIKPDWVIWIPFSISLHICVCFDVYQLLELIYLVFHFLLHLPLMYPSLPYSPVNHYPVMSTWCTWS